MKKYTFILFFFCVFNFLPVHCFSQVNTLDYINNNTLFALYANGEKLFILLTDMIKEGLNSENKNEQAEAIEIYNLISGENIPNNDKNLEIIKEKLNNIKNTGFFVPNGAIKFANYSDGSDYFSLDAKIDIEKIFEIVNKSANNNDLKIIKNSNGLSMVHKNGTTTSVTSNGLKQGKIPEKISSPSKSWEIFNQVGDKSTYLIGEANFEIINQQEQNSKDYISWLEKNSIYKAIHPFYRNLTRLRIIIRDDKSLFMVAYKDEKIRENHKNILQNIIDCYEEAAKLIEKKAKEKNQLDKLKIKLPLKIIDKVPWLGLEANSLLELKDYIKLFPMVMVIEQDIFKKMIKKICDSSSNTLFDKNSTPLGCKKLFEKKNIPFNDNIVSAIQSLDLLTIDLQADIKNYEYEPDKNKIDEHMDLIENFDKNMPWEFLNNFEWDEEKDIFTREEKMVFYPSLRKSLGKYMAVIAKQYKEKYPEKDCSSAFSAILKLFIIYEKSSSSQIGYVTAVESLANCYFFYDGVIDGLFSKDELEKMLESINKYESYRMSFAEKIKKEYENYCSVFIDNSYKNVPVSSIYMHFKAGSPYLANEKAIREYEKGNYYEGDEITEKYIGLDNPYAMRGMLYAQPTIKKKYRAYFALLKAWIEHKLNLPITAKDPYTGETIGYEKLSNGEIDYFFSYDYNKKDKITYFSSYGTKEERKKSDEERKDFLAKKRSEKAQIVEEDDKVDYEAVAKKYMEQKNIKENDDENADEKTICFRQNRLLHGAIEMYNMDQLDENEMITSMKKGKEALKIINILIDNEFLKSAPICPTTGRSSYYLDDDGVVNCEVHGHQ